MGLVSLFEMRRVFYLGMHKAASFITRKMQAKASDVSNISTIE